LIRGELCCGNTALAAKGHADATPADPASFLMNFRRFSMTSSSIKKQT
jgi:hypothetical protein